MSSAGRTAPQELSAGPTFALVALIVIVLCGLWSLDFFLARTEREAVQNEAGRWYQQGEQLLEQGRAAEAVDPLRRASSMVRDNRAYQLAYVTALVAAGRYDEADADLATLLQADPDNGPANLLGARIMVKEGKITETVSHYHRAIYGVWPDNAPAHRMATRLELANLLASRGEQQELLAEVLALEAEAQDTATLKKVAHLYLVAGSPARSAAVYRELVRRTPDDARAYAELGEAELAQGDYDAALAAFLNAGRGGSADPAVDHDMQLCRTITEIDPTPRRLSSSEKYGRSMRILKLARDALDRCVSGSHPANTAALQQMISDCDKLLAQKPPAHVANELAEARLTFAEQLWQARVKTCGSGPTEQEEALKLIMAGLAHL